MLSQQKPNGLTQANFAAWTRLLRVPRYGLALLMATTAIANHMALAETVYRCGDEYSPTAQCTQGHPAAVQTNSELRHSAADKTQSVATHDQQEAEALEKKRLLAQSQAVQNAPVRFSASDPLANLNLNTKAERTPVKHKGKHARKPQSPYFTAVDPNVPPKKKSNAKALPSTN